VFGACSFPTACYGTIFTGSIKDRVHYGRLRYPYHDDQPRPSFRVLVKELQSLGLAVEAITDTGEVIRFGKDEEKQRKPQPDTGLLGLGDR
jgi:hypothetical protein